MVAWTKDFADVMQKHGVSYTIGKFGGDCTITAMARDFIPQKENQSAYVCNAVYKKKTYKLAGYSATYYVNQKLADVSYRRR